jgi:hypothetical protein
MLEGACTHKESLSANAAGAAVGYRRGSPADGYHCWESRESRQSKAKRFRRHLSEEAAIVKNLPLRYPRQALPEPVDEDTTTTEALPRPEMIARVH